MVITDLRLSGQVKRVCHALGLLCLMAMAEKSGAYEFKVGGSGNWAVPADSDSAAYNQWAGKMRFQIGDSLVFNYQGDSVLEVTSQDYTNCNTESPISSSSDGHTVVKFNRSGPHYFISGTKDNCLKNEKLTVVVMADRSGRATNQASPPPPSPSPPPTSDMIPSPAPSGEESPPAGTVEENPTPAPSTEADQPPPTKKKNAASSVAVSFVGSVGVFVASAIAIAF